MKLYYLLIPLCTAGFVALWLLVYKVTSLMGWGRLARYFQVTALPPGPRYSLGLAHIGIMEYRNIAKATVSRQGMGLAVGFLFRVGHPPLLIPWSAFGPFWKKQFLWMTFYKTTIQTDDASIRLSFSSKWLIEAACPWIQMA